MTKYKLSFLTKSSISIFMIVSMFMLLCFSTASLSLGIENNSLYDIEINVSTKPLQSTHQEQQEFIQQGLKELLLKLTGTEKVLDSAIVIEALKNVDHYVKQFRFTSKEGLRFLRVQFNEPLVQELLNKAQISILGPYRPTVLLWLITNENNTTEWINADTQQQTFDLMQTTAKRYGLPVLFPLFDLEDTNKIAIQNILNNEIDPILEASKRYHAHMILIGKLNKKEKDHWYADWTLINIKDKNQTQNWNNQEPVINAVINKGVENLLARVSSVEKLADELEINVEENLKQTSPQHFQVTITGIKDVDQYAKILSHLRKIPEVMSVEVLEMTALQTTFNLETKLQEQILIQNIEKDNPLIEHVPDNESIIIFRIKGTI